MPKTASSAISIELAEVRKWHSWSEGHAPCSGMYEHGPVHIMWIRHQRRPWDIPFHFGGVRNPWDWYGSLWRHTEGRRHFLKERKRFILNHDGFKGFLYGCTHLNEVDIREGERTMVILKAWPGRSAPNGTCGLWSWCVDYFYRMNGRWLVDALIPSDRASEGLSEITGVSRELDLKNTARGRLSSLDPVNENRSQTLTNYRSWYDDDMVSWVKDADRGLLEAFHFTPFEASARAVYRFPGAAINRVPGAKILW